MIRIESEKPRWSARLFGDSQEENFSTSHSKEFLVLTTTKKGI
jgi:hypothetical protein